MFSPLPIKKNHNIKLIGIILIVIFATLVRTWKLDTHAILFGDAAHDLLSAAQAVQQKTIPLLGIPSSLPRFHQGPVTVWLEMALFPLAGYQLWPYSLFFAFISILAVIALYAWVRTFSSEHSALVAALIMATSPLAVAHGRMVYHITPIPLMLVLYLWSLGQILSIGLFWVGLSAALLFQFELALVPLWLLIPYQWWQNRISLTPKNLALVTLGLGVGLTPQILYDLTHGFQHLGGFLAWVGYRFASAAVPSSAHFLSLTKLGQAVQYFSVYLTRITSLDQPLIALPLLLLSLVGIGFMIKRARQNQLAQPWRIILAALALQTTAYFIHGSPSEAYFPPYLIFVSLSIAFLTTQLPPRGQTGLLLGLVGWAGLIVFQLNQKNWFVSNNLAFGYGPGVSEQHQIISYIQQHYPQFEFQTTAEAGKFPAYFDNFRWQALSLGLTESPSSTTILIEQRPSPLNTYPQVIKIPFESVDVFILPGR